MAKSNSFFNIDMLVLSLLKVKDCYGYELVKLIKEISNGSLDIKEGTLYPVVHNLLKKEYISMIFCVNNCINSFLSFEWIEIIFLTYFIYFFISLLIFFAFTICNDFKYTLHILSKFNNCLF